MKPSDYIKKGWTRGAVARDTNGKEVGPGHPKACRWCLFGAYIAAYDPSNSHPFKAKWGLMKRHTLEKYGVDAIAWNDMQKSKHAVLRELKELDE